MESRELLARIDERMSSFERSLNYQAEMNREIRLELKEVLESLKETVAGLNIRLVKAESVTSSLTKFTWILTIPVVGIILEFLLGKRP